MKSPCIILCGMMASLLACSVVYGQNDLDDRGEGTVNHNYFVANQNPQLQQLLAHVENNHLINCPHNNRGGTLADIRDQRYDYAIADMIYTLERFVNHPKALQILVVVIKLSKKRTLAVPYFEKAIALYPSYALTFAQYGAYLADIGELGRGIERLEHAIALDPKLTAAHVWLSRAYEKRGNLEQAREALQQARELGYQGKLSEEATDGK
jgi:tetratricopeptide (TPR) repeat protein